MKRMLFAAISIASLVKILGLPVEANSRTAKPDFRKRQMPNSIFYALIAMTLLAMFALAATAADAQSPLSPESARELERLLGVPAGRVPVPYANAFQPVK
ncbi:MAG: hypothetical protein ACREDD_09950 [Methylocella sp.]